MWGPDGEEYIWKMDKRKCKVSSRYKSRSSLLIAHLAQQKGRGEDTHRQLSSRAQRNCGNSTSSISRDISSGRTYDRSHSYYFHLHGKATPRQSAQTPKQKSVQRADATSLRISHTNHGLDTYNLQALVSQGKSESY